VATDQRPVWGGCSACCVVALRQSQARPGDDRCHDAEFAACRFGGGAIPLLRQKFGADPAMGGSVMITALTDSGGFFIFLGLATLLLM
jgi:hypothetical protein